MLSTCVSRNLFSLAPEAERLHSAFCGTVAHWGKRIFKGATMRTIAELTGQRFGQLVVIKKSVWNGAKAWLCICDCGNKKTIPTSSLRSGCSKSCGCLQKKLASERAKLTKTHGLSFHPLYKTWHHMIARCYDPDHHAYKDYGARGIKVCDRWKESVEAFIKDMGIRPNGKTLDRKNNDGDYEPSNCRWATDEQQHQNTRGVREITLNGVTLCASAWARRIGVSTSTVCRRLNKNWPIERVLQP